jgi:hypothetical protein
VEFTGNYVERELVGCSGTVGLFWNCPRNDHNTALKSEAIGKFHLVVYNEIMIPFS